MEQLLEAEQRAAEWMRKKPKRFHLRRSKILPMCPPPDLVEEVMLKFAHVNPI